ncbi:hypothetical protein [Amycolatopsis taiwanensis]|uniref:DUF4352 domain-containing protein n=1 Tax=Amycolatopsis taiwanensis TaxID=342230 RepID=A0A9W6R3E7_9PSEU|nr:hypothetical protein [Amycolatopsis taiwanensis]GLY68786.1 hypothetical protein Atai01_54050 [Amycolatopsis taiwanensis]
MTDQQPQPNYQPMQPTYPAPTPPPRRTRTLVILAIVGALVVAGASVGITLALTGGGGGTSQAAAPNRQGPPALPTISSSPSTSPTVPLNARRNVEKQIGETTGWGVDAKHQDVQFSVTKITVDGKCTEPYAEKPQNGHLIFVDMSISTSPTMDRTYASAVLNPYNFSIIGPDGVTESGQSLTSTSTYGCLASSKQIPGTLSPGQKYVGTFVLDSRSTSGALVLAPQNGFDNGGNGWEWKFGQTS